MGTITALRTAVQITEEIENLCTRCACKDSDRCYNCDTKETTHHIIKNGNCYIEYTPTAKHANNVFDGDDITDQNNLPAFYSTTSRSHKKAWAALKDQFTSDTTMHGAISILWDNGVKCHSWCRMD